MHSLVFIQDLAVIMLVAGLITVICHYLKQPIVLGYILAGILIGPHTPPFMLISDETTIKIFADLGVIFLMFSLGLEFNLHHLSKVGLTAFITAFSEITVMMWLGYEIGRFFNWSKMDAIFLGAILSISSTTIIFKALDELGMKKKKFAQLIFGVLVIEDVFAIIILAVLSTFTINNSLDFHNIAITITKFSSFLVVTLLVGLLLLPRLLSYIAKFNNNELLLVSVLGLCFGFCLLVIKLNYSVALGAFLIGAIIAESEQFKLIDQLIIPLRHTFSAIFFVSVGLLLNPHIVAAYATPIFIISVAVVIGKIIGASLGVLITGRNGKTAMKVGTGLAQIGEFSFIIASLGISLNMTSDFLYSIAVAVCAITTLLTPYLIKYSNSLTRTTATLIPQKVSSTFGLYSSWIQNIQPLKEQAELNKIVRRCLIHSLVNLLVITSIFFSGAYIAQTEIGDMLATVTHENIKKTFIWGIALTLSLPFLIAIYRKIKALSMILAELSVKEGARTKFTINVRAVISEIIPIISMIIILIFVSALSSSILPPTELLMMILLIVAALISLLFPWFIKLHSRLQISLLDTLKKNSSENTSVEK